MHVGARGISPVCVCLFAQTLTIWLCSRGQTGCSAFLCLRPSLYVIGRFHAFQKASEWYKCRCQWLVSLVCIVLTGVTGIKGHFLYNTSLKLFSLNPDLWFKNAFNYSFSYKELTSSVTEFMNLNWFWNVQLKNNSLYSIWHKKYTFRYILHYISK